MGAILLQERTLDTAFHLVKFFLRKLTSTQQAYSAIDREMLAIVKSLYYWRGYLLGSVCVLFW